MEYNCEWLKYHINDIDPPTFPCEWAKRNWHKTASQITEPFPCDNLREKWEGGGDNYRTVLYTDGTLIINEKESDIAKNVALHGDATNVYPALDATHPYEFADSTERYWNTERRQIRSVEFGSLVKPVSTRAWFKQCNRLVSFNTTNLDTRNVTTMQEMFYGCGILTPLDLSGFDTSSVTNMMFMFGNCKSLTPLDLSGFDTSSVTNMESMFEGCESLTTLNLSGFDTSSATTMMFMFNGCKALTTLDLSGFDTSSVTNMHEMFSQCGVLETIFASSSFNTSRVPVSHNPFFQNTSLVGGAGTVYDDAHTNKEYARIDNPPTEPGYFTAK